MGTYEITVHDVENEPDHPATSEAGGDRCHEGSIEILEVPPGYLYPPASHGEILRPIDPIWIQTVKMEKDLEGPDPGLSDGSRPKHEDPDRPRSPFPSGHIGHCLPFAPRLAIGSCSKAFLRFVNIIFSPRDGWQPAF